MVRIFEFFNFLIRRYRPLGIRREEDCKFYRSMQFPIQINIDDIYSIILGTLPSEKAILKLQLPYPTLK